MLYAFLGSTLLGALSSAFLLWRKSVLETKLAKSQASDKDAQERANRAVSELELQSKAFQDQLSRQRDQLETLRVQRDQAIDALAKSGAPGALLGVLRKQALKPGDSSQSST